MNLLEMGIGKSEGNKGKYKQKSIKYLERKCHNESHYFVL